MASINRGERVLLAFDLKKGASATNYRQGNSPSRIVRTADGYGHRWCQLVFMYLVFFALIASLVLLISAGTYDFLGIFKNGLYYVRTTYATHMTAAEWAYYIRYFLYLWMFVLVLYTLTHTCRAGISGYLYYSPELFPWYFYLVILLTVALLILWLFLFDDEMILAAFLCYVLVTIGVGIALTISISTLTRERENMLQNGLNLEPGLCVGLVHNGLGVYFDWSFYICLMQLSMMMHHVYDISMDTATTVALVIWFIAWLTLVLIDILALDRHIRWLVIPYFVTLWAVIGVFWENYDVASEFNSILMIVMLCAVIFGTFLKFGVSIYRECSRFAGFRDSNGSNDSQRPYVTTDHSPPSHWSSARVMHRSFHDRAGPSRGYKVYESTLGDQYRY